MADRHIRGVHAVVAPYLQSCMKRGLFNRVNIVSMMYLQAMASQSVFLLENELRAAHGVDVTSQEFVEQHAQTIIDLLLA